MTVPTRRQAAAGENDRDKLSIPSTQGGKERLVGDKKIYRRLRPIHDVSYFGRRDLHPYGTMPRTE